MLKCIKSLGDNEEMTESRRPGNVLLLTMLLCGQLCQTIYSLKIIAMNTSDDRVLFQVSRLLKTSKPGKHKEPLVFKACSPDSALCVVRCVKQYLKNQKVGIIVRISCGLNRYVNVKPFKPVHKDFKIRYKYICLWSTQYSFYIYISSIR